MKVRQALSNFLVELSESELSRQVIVPLIDKIHGGRVEYTHSSLEAGRDIVSFGKDYLGRDHVLVVQVRRAKISYGARAFGGLIGELRQAKSEGVTTESGHKVIPHEVWYVTPQAFPEQHRRQVSDSLRELDKESIKIVAGEELLSLIWREIPDVVQEFSQMASTRVSQIIRRLLENPELRAFGLVTEKSIDEFYVAATLSPRAEIGYLAAAGYVEVPDATTYESLRVRSFLEQQYNANLQNEPRSLAAALQTEAMRHVRKKNIIRKHRIQCVAFCDLDRETVEVAVSEDRFIRVEVVISLNSKFEELVSSCGRALAKCPSRLERDTKLVRAAAESLRELDEFVRSAQQALDAEVYIPRFTQVSSKRIRVEESANILGLDKFVLIDGPPGCGKTTFMKVLAVDLLRNDDPVLFVPCHKIQPTDGKSSLFDIAKRYAMTSIDKKFRSKKAVLLLDGLDEASLDLSKKIVANLHRFRNIIASTRTAHLPTIQAKAFCMTLAPFTGPERDLFLEKWLESREGALTEAREIIKAHEDVDIHTRLPLVGTIFVALLQHGYSPRTRTDMYEKRLELLLSRWDKAKGVDRYKIDNPVAKKHFLTHLAYYLHSSGSRRRTATWDELLDVYEQSLGSWGYDFSAGDFIRDLIFGNGVLVEFGEDQYSLGHLTFQEHLVGEYLFGRVRSTSRIAEYMGKDWWREPLNFYASRMGALDSLIDKLMETEAVVSHAQQLDEMVRYAPYTSPGAVECIRELCSDQTESEFL